MEAEMRYLKRIVGKAKYDRVGNEKKKKRKVTEQEAIKVWRWTDRSGRSG